MKNDFEEIIEKIEEDLRKNKNKKYKGIPVEAVLLDENNNFLESKINKKSDTQNNHLTHAEYLILKNISEYKNFKNMKMLITIPPCDLCIKEIEKYKQITEIIFLTEKCILRTNNKKYKKKKYIKKYETSNEKEKKLIEKIEKYWCMCQNQKWKN